MIVTREDWEGKFGDAYTDRNRDISGRSEFWNALIHRHGVTSILEVGCGTGANLHGLDVPAMGVDVNQKALDMVPRSIPTRRAAAAHLPYQRNHFDMVTTFGVLIHIPPDGIERAMEEIARVARRFVFCGEYLGSDEIPYRGGVLWRREYGALYEDMGLECIESGILEGEPWDKGRVDWWLLRA